MIFQSMSDSVLVQQVVQGGSMSFSDVVHRYYTEPRPQPNQSTTFQFTGTAILMVIGGAIQGLGDGAASYLADSPIAFWGFGSDNKAGLYSYDAATGASGSTSYSLPMFTNYTQTSVTVTMPGVWMSWRGMRTLEID